MSARSAKAKAPAKKKSSNKTPSQIDKEVLRLAKREKRLIVDEIPEELDLSLNEVESSIGRLKKKGFIRERVEMHQVKYRPVIYYNMFHEDDPEETTKTAWKDFNNLPCLLCKDIEKCKEGQFRFNPLTCEYFNNWLLAEKEGTPFPNPFKDRYVDQKEKKALETELRKQKEEEEKEQWEKQRREAAKKAAQQRAERRKAQQERKKLLLRKRELLLKKKKLELLKKKQQEQKSKK